jgi:hypothetical protein
VDQRCHGLADTPPSFLVEDEPLYRLGAHDALALPPVHLHRGRWALHHTLLVRPPVDRQADEEEVLWGLVGVCLDSKGWRGAKLREGIARQAGTPDTAGQFYGLIREDTWAGFLLQAGDRDWRREGEAGRALEMATPRGADCFLYCAPVPAAAHTRLWTADPLAGEAGLLNPVLAFIVINDRWYRQ